VREHFADCKTLKTIRLSMNKATGECKGVGWLLVDDSAEAEWLVNEWNDEPFNEMHGRHMQISYAQSSSSWKPKKAGPAVFGSSLQCRYGASCSRSDCTFKHPDGWDAKSNKGNGKGGEDLATKAARIVCKYGHDCTHPNCFFSHPNGRRKDGNYKQPAVEEHVSSEADGSTLKQEALTSGKRRKSDVQDVVVQEIDTAEDCGKAKRVEFPADTIAESETTLLPRKTKKLKKKTGNATLSSAADLGESTPTGGDVGTVKKLKRKKRLQENLLEQQHFEDSDDAEEPARRTGSSNRKKKKKKVLP